MSWHDNLFTEGTWHSDLWVTYGTTPIVTQITILDQIIADLEKLPSENPWGAGVWVPGVWDECRLLTEIIREFEN
jgi:hypothetical protein